MTWIDRTDLGIKDDFPETNYKYSELRALARNIYQDYVGKGFKMIDHGLEMVPNEILNLADR